MALSWSAAVALANKIASDVPAIKAMLDALATMDFTGITDLPASVKRMASVTGGVQLQKYASNAWATVGKLMHDVDTVDGKHASTGTTASTIPVRDANGKLPGDITGNASTASEASALMDGYTVPLEKGGTGATTTADARANLGADNAANITKGTLSTARGGTGRTDGFVTDVIIDASGTKASDVGQLGRAKSLTSVDANTILKQGCYNVYEATTALNFPIAGDMLLDVIYWGDDNITQRCSSASNSYKFEMSRSSYDNGATWGGWLPVSGFLNSDVHIYVAKNGSDTNSGYTSDNPVLSVGVAAYKMLMMKPGVSGSVYLHFGPGEWGNLTLYNFHSSGAAIVVTTLDGANATADPEDMPKFGTITAANGAMVLLRNIEADCAACSYQSIINAQYYNKIGAVAACYSGRLIFDSTSVTGIKAQTVQTSCYCNAYRHGLVDIIDGATFDILENVSYSTAFLYAVDYSVINIGSSLTASSFKNATRVTGKKFHFVSAEIVDPNTCRTLFPGTAPGTYNSGNLINGMATDVTVNGTISDTAVKRGQIGDAVVVSAPDYNALLSSGFYHCYRTDAQNGPGNYAAKLHVLASGNYICQIAYRINDVGASVRVSQDKGATWTAWAELATKNDVTASLLSYLPLSGGTLTGNVVFPVNEADVNIKTLRLGIRAADTDGTARDFYPIRVIPGSTVGRGLVISPGGPTLLGGGESAQTVAAGLIGAGKLNGETECTFITSDNGIEFFYGQHKGYDVTKRVAISSAGDIDMPGKITASRGFKGNVEGTATTATKWNGAAKTVSTAMPSGGADGDIWFRYTA